MSARGPWLALAVVLAAGCTTDTWSFCPQGHCAVVAVDTGTSGATDTDTAMGADTGTVAGADTGTPAGVDTGIADVGPPDTGLPTCGGQGQPCCATAPTCGTGLACAAGRCAPRMLGSACSAHDDCRSALGATTLCETDNGWPGGYCTSLRACADASSLGAPCLTDGVCGPGVVNVASTVYCLRRCTSDDDCRRPDYACRQVGTTSARACVPARCPFSGAPCCPCA